MKRRVLAILTALVMFMSAVGVPTITRAETTGRAWEWTRLKGSGRYGTMAAITDEAYPAAQNGKLKTLIVATGESFPDALSGAALAGVYGCPIITTKTDALRAEAKKEIERLASKDGCKVYVLGGSGAVSDDVLNAINEIEGVTAERIKGSNREATAIEVYKNGKAADNGFAGNDTFILATSKGYADTLSISPYAYASKTPILLTKQDGTLRDSVKDVILDAANGFKKAIIVGGTGVVTQETEDILTAGGIEVLRLKGKNRYATSAEIVKWELGLNTEATIQPAVKMKSEGMGVAVGENFPDALASANLLGKTRSVLLLVKNVEATDQPNIDELIAPYTDKMTKGYIFGGTGAVTAATEALLNAAVPIVPIYETAEEILTALYALERNTVLSGGHKYELEGKITAVNTKYSEDYNNITVTMEVEGFEDKPVQAFRMTADAADTEMSDALKVLKPGDKIKVRGILKDYNGTKEFDTGCLLVGYEEGTEILKARYALKPGETLSNGYEYELEGVITSVVTRYNDQYHNITVTIVVGEYTDYPVVAYRLTAEEANQEMWNAVEVLKVNDTIKVKGALTNYSGTYEFASGSLLIGYTAGEVPPEPEDVTWTKVAFDAITADDTIAVTMSKEENTWILPNTNGSSASPTAEAVTVADGKITTKGSDNYGWVVEKAEDGSFKLRMAANSNNYLYVTNSNSGVRVGTNSSNVFVIDQNYLKNVGQGRYVGVYNAADWRSYTTIHANIKDETLEFWKLGEGGEEPPVEPADDEKLETEYLNLNLGPISVGPGVVSEDMTYPLPLEGGTYSEVKITWESNKPSVAVVDGNLVITQIDEEVVAEVTATLTLNGKTRTKTFTITVTAKEGGEEPEEFTETFVFSELYGETTDLDTVPLGDIVLAFTQETSNDAPKYNTSGKAVRFYAKNRLVVRFAEGKAGTLTKIVINFSGESYAKKITADHGGYVLDGAIGTWTGSVAEEGFVNSDTAQARIASIVVTYVLNN